jgi:hypothetical protein
VKSWKKVKLAAKKMLANMHAWNLGLFVDFTVKAIVLGVIIAGKN